MIPVAKHARIHAGRDFVVGDVHGCFRTVENALRRVGFDPGCDRLFSVGGLVNRGPNSRDFTAELRLGAPKASKPEPPVPNNAKPEHYGFRGWSKNTPGRAHENGDLESSNRGRRSRRYARVPRNCRYEGTPPGHSAIASPCAGARLGAAGYFLGVRVAAATPIRRTPPGRPAPR